MARWRQLLTSLARTLRVLTGRTRIQDRAARRYREAWFRLGSVVVVDEVSETVDGIELRGLRLVTLAREEMFVAPFEDWASNRLVLWAPRLHLDRVSAETVVPLDVHPPQWAEGERELSVSELTAVLRTHGLQNLGRERRPGMPLILELNDHTWLRLRMAKPEGGAPRRVYATWTLPENSCQ